MSELVPAVIEHQPAAQIAPTGDPAAFVAGYVAVADELSKVVRAKKLTQRISGRDHVLVEGWTMLGSMLGVFPVTVWSREILNEAADVTGWEARVEARTRDGAVVGAAEAMCTRAEKTWKNRDDYALRSMAQTRATSKALRQPLGFVMTLAGLEATPAEEMPTDDAAKEAHALLVADVQAGIERLTGDESWTLEATLEAAERSFGRPIKRLEEMKPDELRQILAAMPPDTLPFG